MKSPKKPARSQKKQAANLDMDSVSSAMWEKLMEKLDRAWTENKIDLHTYQVLLDLIEESEESNSGRDLL
jgi:hypothetical protein